MQHKKIFAAILLLGLMILLSGCGFHLQQGMKLAPGFHRMKLQTPDPYGVLTRNLQQYLTLSHIKIVDNLADADTILIILSDDSYQDLLSVSSTQQTRQFNLRVVVVFEITDNKGRVIVPPQTLSETRVITVQSNQILGSSNEANMFYQQIRRSLAAAILNRIASDEVTSMVNAAFPEHEHKKKNKVTSSSLPRNDDILPQSSRRKINQKHRNRSKTSDPLITLNKATMKNI